MTLAVLMCCVKAVEEATAGGEQADRSALGGGDWEHRARAPEERPVGGEAAGTVTGWRRRPRRPRKAPAPGKVEQWATEGQPAAEVPLSEFSSSATLYPKPYKPYTHKETLFNLQIDPTRCVRTAHLRAGGRVSQTGGGFLKEKQGSATLEIILLRIAPSSLGIDTLGLDTLGLGTLGTLWGWDFRETLGWAIQRDSGAGHSGDTLGGWALQGD